MPPISNTPAFPMPDFAKTHDMFDIERGHPGMPLRDYFAIRALQQIMLSPTKDLFVNKLVQDNDLVEDMACRLAYRWADAMLKARALPIPDQGKADEPAAMD